MIMGSCGTCGTMVLFGGQEHSGLKFCSAPCAQQGYVLVLAREVPLENARQLADEIHSGDCPKCAGPGPVDIRNSHQVWSAILLTRWSSHTQIACRRCGAKKQAFAALGSLLLGWWGFPWGLIMTPVQVGRNLFALAKPHAPTQPSDQLVQHSRRLIAHAHLQQQ